MNGILSMYSNNSIVTRTDIGTGDAALLCITTAPGCCDSGESESQWYFPNRSVVPNLGGGFLYYRNRINPDFGGNSGPRSVNLHRKSDGTTTGIFRCDIPDATTSIFVGIYDSGTGESCMFSEGSVDFSKVFPLYDGKNEFRGYTLGSITVVIV